MSLERSDLTGSCLCGEVRFRGRPEGEVTRCHCEQCRRWSGDAFTAVSLRDLQIKGTGLRWYRSSAAAERGFCGACGASLFWRQVGSDLVAVAMGCVDTPSGLVLNRHIFTAFKDDYYQITDDLPQDAEE